ncbi:MAG: peptidoglycan-associated lipoprotein Pal [Rhodocyclaceae bacterium]|nr:MAG: peptidoglycan-associated lipoprotein Pal [Rhodocyclaceae bacterium]
MPQSTVAAAAPVETDAQKIEKLSQTLSKQSVYFDYDNFSVKSQYQPLLQQDASAIKAAPQVAITVEGNADERGSTEYNLALGQKRAEAVKQSLKLLGVPENELEAISYGEEKPRATCHEEKCWSENRRVDFSMKKMP